MMLETWKRAQNLQVATLEEGAIVGRLDDFRQALAKEDGEQLAEILERTLEARESWKEESPEFENPMDMVDRSPWRLFLGRLGVRSPPQG